MESNRLIGFFYKTVDEADPFDGVYMFFAVFFFFRGNGGEFCFAIAEDTESQVMLFGLEQIIQARNGGSQGTQ